MAQMTITEALAELKTIDKRVEKKRQFVLTYLIRQEVFRDPLEKQGGAADAIGRESQAIRDLEERVVAIRRAIGQANQSTEVTVGKDTRTIADWLIWRREVAPKRGQFLAAIRAKIDQSRQEAARRIAGPATGTDGATPADVVVNIDEQELARAVEALEEILGRLDGLLSLKNATLTIDV